MYSTSLVENDVHVFARSTVSMRSAHGPPSGGRFPGVVMISFDREHAQAISAEKHRQPKETNGWCWHSDRNRLCRSVKTNLPQLAIKRCSAFMGHDTLEGNSMRQRFVCLRPSLVGPRSAGCTHAFLAQKQQAFGSEQLSLLTRCPI